MDCFICAGYIEDGLEIWKRCKKHELKKEVKEEIKKEESVNIDFPKSDGDYLKVSSFQDQKLNLTYRGWEKKANEDRKDKSGSISSWKQNLKYVLRYSYPEFALDEAGERIKDADGNDKMNRYYDADFPHGYTIVYHFDEGKLETGSLPLFKAFCAVRPAVGEVLSIGKTGKDKETKWEVRRVEKKPLPDAQIGDSEESPF